MRRPFRHLATMLLCVLSAACVSGGAQGGAGGATTQPRTTVRVENQAFNDMNIYVVQGGQRVRLGTATGNSTTRLIIPPNLLFGATELRFIADPIGGSRTPVSQAITVQAGDEVVLTIPPQGSA